MAKRNAHPELNLRLAQLQAERSRRLGGPGATFTSPLQRTATALRLRVERQGLFLPGQRAAAKDVWDGAKFICSFPSRNSSIEALSAAAHCWPQASMLRGWLCHRQEGSFPFCHLPAPVGLPAPDKNPGPVGAMSSCLPAPGDSTTF
jgi:hypothetical protein